MKSNITKLRQLIFSKSNEFTPSYIKLFLTKRGNKKHIVENCLKYLPLQTQTLEETAQIMQNNPFRFNGVSSKWNHPFVSKEQPNESYIPYSQCKICGDIFTNHKSLVHNRKNHSLPKNCSFMNDNNLKEQITNKQRAKSPVLKHKNIINYNINTFECQICLEQIPVDNKENILCNHAYCKDCIIDYLLQCISDAKVPIKCPYVKCTYEFDNDFVKERVSWEHYDKYKKFLKRKEIAKIKNAIVCPFPNCESYAIIPYEVNNKNENSNKKENDDTVIIHQDMTKALTQNNNKDDDIQTERSNSFQKSNNANERPPIVVKCIDNDHEFCSKCKQIPHPGIACNSTNEEKWNKYKNDNNIKNCPSCGIEISKNGGCNHIHCTCGYDFCWLCGGSFTQDHYSDLFSSCYGKQFDEDNIDINDYNNNWDHCRNCLFVLKLIGIILLCIVLMSIAGFVYIGYMLCIYHRHEMYLNIKNWLKITLLIILYPTATFLGIAMISFGYLFVAGLIIFLPLGIYFKSFSYDIIRTIIDDIFWLFCGR